MRRRAANLIMVPPPIQVGQLDHRVGQVEPQGRTQIAVDNPQIEIQTPAHQRPVADKVEQVAQALFHRHAVVQVHTAQTVNANRLAVQTGRPRHAQVQRRARLVDFTYQHHTMRHGVVNYGGVESGTRDPDAAKTLDAYARFLASRDARARVAADTRPFQRF